MAQGAIKIIVISDTETVKDIENDLSNARVLVNKEEVNEPTKATIFYIANDTLVFSIALNILEPKLDKIQGRIEFFDGKNYQLTKDGMVKLKEMLIEVLNKQGEPKGKQGETTSKPTGWTPEDLEALGKLAIELLGSNLADKYITYKKNDAESERAYFESVSKHNRKMIYVLTGFLALVVAFMSWLTWYKLVSGDALLFLVGTITGYLLLFIQRLVFPSKEPPTEEIPA
jgi:hypothetical protein